MASLPRKQKMLSQLSKRYYSKIVGETNLEIPIMDKYFRPTRHLPARPFHIQTIFFCARLQQIRRVMSHNIIVTRQLFAPLPVLQYIYTLRRYQDDFILYVHVRLVRAHVRGRKMERRRRRTIDRRRREAKLCIVRPNDETEPHCSRKQFEIESRVVKVISSVRHACVRSVSLNPINIGAGTN